jgi:hypothetical protein
MKKIIVLSALLLAACVVVAQDATTEPLKNKKGIAILPEVGEWGLGVSVNPFLDYLGDLANGQAGGNSSPTFDYTANPAGVPFSIFGKYVKSENTYYRARLHITVATDINKEVIGADQLITPPAGFPSFTEDWQKVSSQVIMLAGGIEKRRGSTRIQGFYGGELVLGYSGGKTTYEYGNPISAANQTPTTFDFINGGTISATSRPTEEKEGKGIFVGARGFIGVEYFVAPRLSLSGEFGYTLGLSSTGKTVITEEAWNNGTNSVLSTKTDVYRGGDPDTLIGFRPDNLDGNISILFYF